MVPVKNVALAVLYRPPASTNFDCAISCKNWLNCLNNLSFPFLIMADVNINTFLDDVNARRFDDIMKSNQ